MNSFFQEPRTSQRRPQRRQDREDFFPSFSDSLFFDPFSQSGEAGRSDNDPFFAPHKQRQSRQQHPEQHQEQNRLEQQQKSAQRQRANPHRQQEQTTCQATPLTAGTQHQHHHPEQQQQKHTKLKPPQWRTGQTPLVGPSKRRGRRAHRGEQKEFAEQRTPPSQAASQESESIDDMASLAEAAFGGKSEFAAPTKIVTEPSYQPSTKARPQHKQQYQERPAPKSPASTEQEDELEEEQAEGEVSEEDQMPPNRDLQEMSRVELDQIEENLEEFSKELDQILAGQISNKKRILLSEENLTKAMLRIDAVESGGDPEIRKRRKALINCAEHLLTKVDVFKHRTKTSAT